MPAKPVSMGLKEDNKENNVIAESLSAVENVESGLKKAQSQGLDGGDVVKPAAVAVVAPPTIKELEAQEPLLQENPHRFVLFPIKYHEVRDLLVFFSTFPNAPRHASIYGIARAG